MSDIKIGYKVIKNEDTWIPNDFDSWGRGIGIGVVVEPPFDLEDHELDVRWSDGRCFEQKTEVIKLEN